MRVFSRIARLGLASLFVTGCAGMSVESYRDQKPRLVLEEFFSGPLSAFGVVTNRSGSVVRRFEVKMVGTLQGDTLTLDEDFVWSDGEKQKRVWTFRKVRNDLYEGRADDVVGVARVTQAGFAVRLEYTLRVPVSGRQFDIRLDDWIYAVNDRVVINRARMSKFGIHLGDITLTMIRGTGPTDR